MTIYDSENRLFEEMKRTYRPEEQDLLVQDGLCMKSLALSLNPADSNYWPEEKWIKSEKRVLFLLKEPNGNEGDDYRDWKWADGKETFGNSLAYWLQGLMETNETRVMNYNDLSWRDEILSKYPLAIVNVKKIAGDSTANWDEIRAYAQRDSAIIRKQIREILEPNIIVCGGSNDCGDDSRKMLTIAKEIIFPDLSFEKENSWCHYNEKEDILLIDSYHPSDRKSWATKVNDMLEAYHAFISKRQKL